DERVDRGELLGEVALAPAAADAVRELAPVGARPGRVEREHGPAARREHVAAEVGEAQEVPGEACRPAVDVDEERRRSATLRRQEQPAVDRAAVRVREGAALRARQVEAGEER